MPTQVSWQYYIETQLSHMPNRTRYSGYLLWQTLKVPGLKTDSESLQTNHTYPVGSVTFAYSCF